MDIEEEEIPIFEPAHSIYASFWRRFASSFLDGVIILVLIIPIKEAVGAGDMIHDLIFDHTTSIITFAVYMLSTTVTWLYTVLMQSGKGKATVGMMALGIQATDLNGERISFARATGRFFASYISAFILLLGYFMMLWDEKNQTLHDKIAGTLIVKKQTDSVNS